MVTSGYCKTAELKRRMGSKHGETLTDAMLEEAIEDASRQIDDAINGRSDVITYSAVTLDESQVRAGQSMNAEGLIMDYSRRRIYFPSKINTITAVNDDGNTLTVNEDYILGYDYLEAMGCFTSDLENGVKISGTIGSATIPNDIRELCMQMSMVLCGVSTRLIQDTNGNVFQDSARDFAQTVKKKLKKLARKLL